ncbi:MAG: PQQ-binding-like beta-propeller repeat protein [Verrucomicrobiaceae bacterium]|nr:PQQ-binding-like beta-propeller repeat protein [Verrucomicrobiaceae bacterium]
MKKHFFALLLFATATSLHSEALWPEFRGPTAQGHSTATGLPSRWSKTLGIKWSHALQGRAWSSPVVADGRVFLTNAVEQSSKVRLTVLALDAETGKQSWETELFVVDDPAKLKMHSKNSQASPSPIFEGGLVYVHFGHHGSGCVQAADGKVVWKNNDHPYPAVHGTGGSPLLVDNLLVFNADAASNPSVIALNKADGKLAWKRVRTSPASRKFSFSTPLLIEVNGEKQIITAGSGIVQALRPSDGSEIWHLTYDQGYSVVPRPVFAHDMIFLSTGYDKPSALAIKVGGTGDVTETHLAWRADKRVPHNPSMLVVGDDLYMLDDKGIFSCRDAKTGEVYYEERLLSNSSASLLYADGMIYATDEQGMTAVVKPGHTLQTVAKNDLGEKTLASAAVVDNDLLLRTEKALYRITKK